MRDPRDLIPYHRNARTHSDEQVRQIAASIAEFGFVNPVLIDDRDELIAGHGRVLAALALGLAEVPAITLSHLSDVQRRALVLADNRIAANAGWNEAILSRELAALQDVGFDLTVVAFTDQEVEDLLNGLEDGFFTASTTLAPINPADLLGRYDEPPGAPLPPADADPDPVDMEKPGAVDLPAPGFYLVPVFVDADGVHPAELAGDPPQLVRAAVDQPKTQWQKATTFAPQ